MLEIKLTESEKKELKRFHRTLKDGKSRDRIKAMLMLDNGYSCGETAEILILDENTITEWKKRYLVRKNFTSWLFNECQGYSGKLAEKEEKIVEQYVEENLITDSKMVKEFIKLKFNQEYSVNGVIELLKRLGFNYKMTNLIPSKYDGEAQKKFEAKYEELQKSLQNNEVILFGDGVHPQHNTKCSKAWIKTGKKKEIKSNTGRQRININGVYNAQNQDVIAIESKTINAQTTIELFKKIEIFYSKKDKIYIIVDNAKYYKNYLLKEYLKDSRIELMFLPPYSPNLNLIERLWKLMRKKKINSIYYEHFKDFRNAILDFLEDCSNNRTEIKKFIGCKMHLLNS